MQGSTLHTLSCLAGPGQSEPVPAGFGLSQILSRDCTPPPQVTEQGDQEDQADQSPSIFTNAKNTETGCENSYLITYI